MGYVRYDERSIYVLYNHVGCTVLLCYAGLFHLENHFLVRVYMEREYHGPQSVGTVNACRGLGGFQRESVTVLIARV